MKFNFHIRQTIALIIAVSFFSISNAQTPLWDTLPWKQYADYKLQNLNKIYVTTGVLYDRVFPIANVDEYTGQPATTNTDTVSSEYFMQAYYEMYNATYNTQNMLSPEGIDSTIDSLQYAVHPIGVLLYKFNSLDTNALQDHLIDTLANGQFVDVANRPRSPYFTNTGFTASPLLAEGEVLEEGEQAFSIDPRFFLNNSGLSIKQVKIDFGDGQGYWIVDNPSAAGAARPMGSGVGVYK